MNPDLIPGLIPDLSLARRLFKRQLDLKVTGNVACTIHANMLKPASRQFLAMLYQGA
jgi:hypothetical protein